MKQLKCIVLLLLLVPFTGLAEENENIVLDEIVVTATRTDREIKDVATNITVLTQDDIKQYQPANITDLLNHVPGLVINGMGSIMSTVYAGSRGISPSSRGLLLMIDGIEVNEPTNYITALNVPMNNIERVEVIKTPSSVLYGPTAVGGMINIITKTPAKPVEAQASVLYGSNNHTEASVNTLGISPQGLTYNLNYWYLNTDGYRNHGYTNQNQFMPRLGYTKGDIKLEFFSFFTETQDGFPGGLPLNTYKNDPTTSLQPDRNGDSYQTNSGATLTWKTSSDSRLQMKSYYRTNEWNTQDYGLYFKGKPNNWTNEATYQQNVPIMNMPHTFLLGGQYVRIQNNPEMYMDENFKGTKLSSVDLDGDNTGFFLQDEVRLTSNIMASAGIRYDMFTTDYINNLKPSGSFHNDDSKWSPRMGLTYSPLPALNVFANYSQGIRSVVLARSVFQLTQNVKPEEEESYELGIRGVLMKKMEYSLAGFHIDTKDKIVQTNGRYKYENAGKATSNGIETSLGMYLTDRLHAMANYTYLDAKFDDFQTASANYDDKSVPLVPHHIIGLSGDWNDPTFGRISAAVQYVSSKYIDRDYANLYQLDDYAIVDLKYTYTLRNLMELKDPMEISVGVNNLFDKIYAQYAEIDGGSYVPGPVAYPADGRTFYVQLSAFF